MDVSVTPRRSLLDMKDADFTDASAFKPDRSRAADAPWPLVKAEAVAPPKKKMKAEWPTSVIEKSVNAFVPLPRVRKIIFFAVHADEWRARSSGRRS